MISGRALLAVRVALLALLAFSAWQLTHFRTETAIAQFIPEGESRDKINLGGLIKATSFTRGMILDVEVPAGEVDADAAAALSDELARQLREAGPFTRVTNGVDVASGEAFHRIYFPRRYALLSDRPEDEIPAQFGDTGLTEAFAALHAQLALPSGMLLKRIADQDPTLAFPALLQRLEGQRAHMAPHLFNGRFFSPDHRHVLLVVETEADAFDAKAQQGIIDTVHAVFERVDAAAGGGHTLTYTGLNRFALESETRIRRDVQWASTSATLGVLVLFVLFFRRPRLLLLCGSPLLFGVAVALGVTLAIFGSIHGLTLAFGSTLLGVCIDYPVHLLNHLRFTRDRADEQRRRSSRRIRASLSIGMLTTLAGYAMVGVSSFPGVRQIAVFSSVGIAASFLFTLAFLPPLSSWALAGRAPVLGGWMRRMSGWTALGPYRRGIAVALVALALVGAAGIPLISLQTDARAFDIADPGTLAEDEAIRSRMPAASFPLYLLTSGADAEAALQNNEALAQQLEILCEQGHVTRHASIRWLLPSVRMQRRNLEALASVEHTEEAARSAMEAAGFRPEAFAAFFDDLRAARAGEVPPLTPELLLESSLGDLVRGFVLEFNGRTYVLTLVQPAVEGDDLSSVLPEDEHLVRFSGLAVASAVMSDTQRQIAWLGLAGLVLNGIILVLYRRRPSGLAATLAPASVAIVVVLGILGFSGTKMSFFHVMSLLLVLSSGVDYAVFLSDSRRSGEGDDAAIASVSVLFSALTTALVFGALAACQTPALRAIGGTVAGGILLACALAFVMAGVERDRG